MKDKKLTGYPHIDKPWLKYYSQEAINAPLPKMTMYEYIWQNNKDYLEDIALEYYGTKISYRSLFDSIKKAANVFYDLGVKKGDIVTIMSMHTPETIYAIYGLNYIGATANLVYMTLAEKEIIDTINNTESKLLLVLDVALDKINNIKDQINIPTIILGVSDSMPFHIKLGYKLKVKPKRYEYQSFKRLLDNSKDTNPPQSKDHEAPAVIVYTSGTTGEPKGVLLSGNGLNAIAHQLIASYGDKKRQETVLMVLPPFIAFGISMIHRALCTGMDMTLWIEMDSDRIAKAFGKLKPNRFVSGPLLIEGIMKHTTGDLSNVYDITGGGEAITSDLEDRFNSFLQSHNSRARYMTGYGMSEFGSVITLNWLHAYKKDSVGIPLPLARIKIVEPEAERELGYDEIGEIVVSTPCAMIEYYNNEAATKEVVFNDNAGLRWIRTGDLGYIDEDGFVYITGRVKRIYITKGKDGMAYKIFPQRIEEIVIKNNEVEMCGCIALPDEQREHVAVVFVVLRNNSNKKEVIDRLNELLRNELPEHSMPQDVYVIDEMPMTHSGKIDYQILEKLAKEEFHNA